MKNKNIEKEIEQAKASVSICKQNIENMKKYLSETYERINSVQKVLKNNTATTKSEIIKLTAYHSKLTKLASSQNSVIVELQKELKIAEDKLIIIKKNALHNNI